MDEGDRFSDWRLMTTLDCPIAAKKLSRTLRRWTKCSLHHLCRRLYLVTAIACAIGACDFAALADQNGNSPKEQNRVLPSLPDHQYSTQEIADFFRRVASVLKVKDAIPSKTRPFCEMFLSDLMAMHNIKFVEPVIRAKTLDDPRLVKYTKRCPNLKINELEDDAPQVWPPVHFYSTRDFVLYRTNILDNEKNDDDYVFYSGDDNCKTSDRTANQCISPVYKIVNFDKCTSEILSIVPVPYNSAEPDGDVNKSIDKLGRTSIIIYKHKHYFLSAGYTIFYQHSSVDNFALQTRGVLSGDAALNKNVNLFTCRYAPEGTVTQ